MAFATAYTDKDEQWWQSVIFSDEKAFGWDLILLHLKWLFIYYFICNYIYIYIYIFYMYYVLFHTLYRSHECGRPFVIRTNGTRFVPGHTFSVKRSGRKSIPVWG
jgi:hypothetical protein